MKPEKSEKQTISVDNEEAFNEFCNAVQNKETKRPNIPQVRIADSAPPLSNGVDFEKNVFKSMQEIKDMLQKICIKFDIK